jgi:hypothetical protein
MARAQRRIVFRLRTSLPAGDGHFTQDARPDLAAAGILHGFAVLDIGPFAVSCHNQLSVAKGASGRL